MRMRRGFKTEAEQHAVELRQELGLADDACLCPWRLAEHLEIPVHTLATIASVAPEAARYLHGVGSDYFSAVTLFVGRHGLSRTICHNESHGPNRQRSNLMHELAHAVLLHPPTEMFACDPESEAEAAWLGGALLVPRAAAIKIATSRMAVDIAAKSYGVSKKMMNYRLGVTGATTIAKRRNSKTYS